MKRALDEFGREVGKTFEKHGGKFTGFINLQVANFTHLCLKGILKGRHWI
jgi:hypothetical protein